MTEVLAIREKHDGALGDRSGVRLWLRLLSCTMADGEGCAAPPRGARRHARRASTCSRPSTGSAKA